MEADGERHAKELQMRRMEPTSGRVFLMVKNESERIEQSVRVTVIVRSE